MRRKRLLLAVLCLATIAAPLGVPGLGSPAHANGVGALEFVATGTLPTYPTNGEIKTAYISGSLTGNAQVTATYGSRVITANFTLKAAPFVNQPIQYQVNGSPYCLLASQAAGSLTYPYNGWMTVDTPAPTVSGQVYVSGDTVMGGVTRTVITFKFTYQRVGAATVVVATPGTITVYWQNVNGTSGSFSTGFTGAGPGLVQYTDAVGATQACVTGPARPVGFAVTGNVELAGA